ncbi:hypothetical protein [Halovivax sp.]|uniref:hypothetical protein n=1 Tax=Halovivax sp. TaxID=1935978 RepID=UPI0025C23E4F|nr:hypothetical protein [Halovivax sp.]
MTESAAIDPDFWRLLGTISATMIGPVFIGTTYFLESGRAEFDVYRREMAALTVSGARLVIAYFSTTLVLSLFREPFLPEALTVVAVVALAVGVVAVTRSTNAALRAFEASPGTDRRRRRVRRGRYHRPPRVERRTRRLARPQRRLGRPSAS